jgi:hypothetical protein
VPFSYEQTCCFSGNATHPDEKNQDNQILVVHKTINDLEKTIEFSSHTQTQADNNVTCYTACKALSILIAAALESIKQIQTASYHSSVSS